MGGEGNIGQQGHETQWWRGKYRAARARDTVGGEGNIGQQGHETQWVEREI